jgi:hypothetical protein
MRNRGDRHEPHGDRDRRPLIVGPTLTIHGHQGFAPTLSPEAMQVCVDAGGVRFAVAVA